MFEDLFVCFFWGGCFVVWGLGEVLFGCFVLRQCLYYVALAAPEPKPRLASNSEDGDTHTHTLPPERGK